MRSIPITLSLLAASSLANSAAAQFAGFGPLSYVLQQPTDNSFRGARWVYTADFDGDGDQDVVAPGPTGFSILFNDGTGNLSGEVWYAVGCFCGGRIKAADLNGDGLDDIAMMRPGSTLSVWLNNGDGTLGVRSDIAAGVDANSGDALAIVDLDGDLDLDLAATSSSGVTQLFMNDGAGAITAGAIFPIGLGLSSTGANDAIDIDGDGDADLVMPVRLNNDNNQYRLIRLINDGSGGFTLHPTLIVLPAHSFPRDLISIDLEGNGHDDVVISQTNGGNLLVLRSDGVGGLFPFQVVDTGLGNNMGQVAAADLNGDGLPDLAVGDDNSPNTSVLINTGGGTFAPPAHYANTILSGSPVAAGVALADLDGNQSADLITASWGSGGPFTTVINTRLNLTPTAPAGPFDLTGPADALTGVPLPETMLLWGQGGSPQFGWSQPDGFGIGYEVIIATDPSLASTVFTSPVINEQALAVPTGVLDHGTTYYWSVSAINSEGVTGATNGPFSFTTAAPPTTSCTGDIADDFGTLGVVDGEVSFGDFLALLGLVGPCP